MVFFPPTFETIPAVSLFLILCCFSSSNLNTIQYENSGVWNRNGGDHSTFICGNNIAAKKEVKGLLKSFGWKENNIFDLGNITSARGTEMYLPLWLRIWGATNNGAFNIKIVN